MKKIKIIKLFFFTSLAFVLLLLSSCDCKSWGDNNLGREFTLLEGDKINDRVIIYCIGRENPEDCCTGGIPIIPSREDKSVDYIELAESNDRWIITKSIGFDKTESYWYIDKHFDTTWEYDDGGVFYNRIQNHVYGPFDKTTFNKELKGKNINLMLNK